MNMWNMMIWLDIADMNGNLHKLTEIELLKLKNEHPDVYAEYIRIQEQRALDEKYKTYKCLPIFFMTFAIIFLISTIIMSCFLNKVVIRGHDIDYCLGNEISAMIKQSELSNSVMYKKSTSGVTDDCYYINVDGKSIYFDYNPMNTKSTYSVSYTNDYLVPIIVVTSIVALGFTVLSILFFLKYKKLKTVL